MKKNNTIKRIVDYFNHRDEVSVLYIFGSFGSRKETKESDIDIAVLVDETRLKKKNFADLKKDYYSASPTFSMRPVDIVILNTAPSFLKHHILKTGRILYEKNRNLRISFTTKAIIEYLDYKPVEDICLKAIANRFRRSAIG
ncbi:MAG: type VII toxin-antitoxin system MntA family adenylyltransferase antitoxin [bacterium]